MRKTKYLKSNMNNSRLLGLKFVRALNNYSKWRRFWTSPVQVTKNLESSRLACTGIPSTTGSPKITKRSPNVERNDRGLGVNKGTVRILKITKKIARERLKEEDAFLNSKRNWWTTIFRLGSRKNLSQVCLWTTLMRIALPWSALRVLGKLVLSVKTKVYFLNQHLMLLSLLWLRNKHEFFQRSIYKIKQGPRMKIGPCKFAI